MINVLIYPKITKCSDQNLVPRDILAIHHAHKQLGSHVRIAPNHIAVLSEDAVIDIYGHGTGMLKDIWYDGGAGDFRHMADVRVKAEHQAKRKLLAHVFAQKIIANLEPVVAGTVSTLMAQVDRHIGAGKTINTRRFMNYFAIDLFGKLLYSRHLGCLERGDDDVTAETPGGRTYTAPFIRSLLDATVINTQSCHMLIIRHIALLSLGEHFLNRIALTELR